MDEVFYLAASSTCPFVAYKFNINFTVYNVDAAVMSYFYHHNDQIFSWINDGFCKPVENSGVLLLQANHYWCIKAKGMEVPTIDPGNHIKAHKAKFKVENVNALEMNSDNSDDDSEKDSEGNYRETMTNKTSHKFVAEEKQKIKSVMGNPNEERMGCMLWMGKCLKWS